MPKSNAVELTDALIRSLPVPDSGRSYHSDSRVSGLQLVVTSTGRRSWWLQYRLQSAGRRGTPRRLALGNYPTVTLASARIAAKQHAGVIAKGEDPSAARQQSLAHERARPTVAELAPRWLASHSVEASTHAGYRMALDNHLLPALGKLKVAEVERRHIAALHAKLKPVPSAANRVLAVASLLMGFAETDGARPPHSNPVFGIKRYKETKRQRFLSHAELATLGAVLVQAEREGIPASPAMRTKKSGMSKARRAKLGSRAKRGQYQKSSEPSEDQARKVVPADRYSVAALRMMLLTGWRMAEVVASRWSDIDLEARVARHRTTKGGATARPLSAPAAALLSDLPRVEGSAWVFPRANDPSKAAGKPRRLWDAVRHAAGLDSSDKAERVVPHDLRHSVGAVAASSGASMQVIASLLGHKQVSTTERYSHLHRDARHDAADQVGEIIAAALSGGSTSRESPQRTLTLRRKSGNDSSMRKG